MPFAINSATKCAVIHIYGTHGKFSHVSGMEKLIRDGIVEEYHLHKTPGMGLTSDELSSQNRVLGVIIKFKNEQELDFKKKTLGGSLSIFNNEGIDVFLREVL